MALAILRCDLDARGDLLRKRGLRLLLQGAASTVRVCVVTRVIRVIRVGWELLYWAAHALIFAAASDTRTWTQGGVEKIPDQLVVEEGRS